MLSELIEALQICLKYGDVSYPTHCEHDTLYLCIEAKKFSQEDKDKLKTLGFIEHEEGFKSYKFGSA
jgi:hypothetical protein